MATCGGETAPVCFLEGAADAINAVEALAQGMCNREIGAALLMSVGTVAAHLTRTCRKLGIRSRSEFAGRVADGSI